MTLFEQIDQDYLQSYKNRDTQKVEVLRLLKSSLKNEAIKIGGLGTNLTDEQSFAVLNREVKQRKDSIEQYKAAGRNELVEKEAGELTVIESYLPQAMDDSALNSIIDAVMSETGATQKSDMGKVMGALKQQLTNPADISKAAALVSQKLQ
jgi:uncharacterized protein